MEELAQLVLEHQQTGCGDLAGGQQVRLAADLAVIAQGDLAQDLALSDRGQHRVVGQGDLPLDVLGGDIVGQQGLHILRRTEGHIVHLPGQFHRRLLNGLGGAEDGLAGEVVKAPLKEAAGLVKAHDPGLAVHFLLLSAQHHTDEGAAALLGGGDQTVPCVRGGAGLDAVGIGVSIADGPPVGEQVVGGVQYPLLREIGGRHGVLGGVADGHEGGILHGLLGDQVHIPGGGVVLGVMKAGGVGKVGVSAAQGLGLGIHHIHKGGDSACHLLAQDIASLVGGDHQHAVEHLLHRHGLTLLNTGGAAVIAEAGKGSGCGGDLLIQRQLALIHGLQHQQRRHDLGQGGGVELIIFVFGIEDLSCVPVHQKGGLGIYFHSRDAVLPIFCRSAGNSQKAAKKGQQQKNRKKSLAFHIHLPHSVL